MNVNKKLYGLLSGLVFYGLTMSSAHALLIEGTSSGIFANPTGPSGMVVTGVVTSSFTWGDGSAFNSPPSSMDFSGTPFSTNTETFFDMGELNYFNGAIADGTEADTVDLGITLNFTTPSGVNEAFTYLLSLVNTPNNGTPEQNADIVQFPSTLPLETFIFDGITFSVGLEVGVVTGDGFSSQTTFSVLEDSSATATLRGIVTSEGDLPQAVPEPTTLVLLSLGLAGLGFTRRKKVA